MCNSSITAQSYPVRLIQTDISEGQYPFKDTIIQIKKKETKDEVLRRVLDQLIHDNYIAASIDSTVLDTAKALFNSYVHVGKAYNFKTLSFDSSSQAFLKKIKVRQASNAQEFILMREQISDYYSNNGYPFTKVKIKDLKIENEDIKGQLDIDTGPQIIIDSLNIEGDVKIRKAYLENYTDIFTGEVYNHQKIKSLKNKLEKLTFLKLEKDPDLTFYQSLSTVNLYLKKKNSSRFDLLFGVIPTNNLGEQQLFLSLDFTAEMLNKLGYGEYIFIDFERLRPEQQKFEVQFNYPYLLDTPFAIDADFSIFRNGLNYQTLLTDLGVQYLLNSTDYIKLAWNYESSNLVEIDTEALLASGELPEDLDVSQSGLALELFIDKLDYRFNPRSGYRLNFRGVGGQRSIQRNSSIFTLKNDNDDFSTSYETLQLNTPRFELETSMSYFLPLALRGTIGFHLNGGWRYTSTGLYRNEKFQIGGNKLLRGFDEASLFTKFYGIVTLEYRLLLSNNSYFSFPFVDIGYIENIEGGSDLVTGIGGGLGFETKVGLFNFSIAVGKNSQQSFDFGKPKAHFGFVSLF